MATPQVASSEPTVAATPAQIPSSSSTTSAVPPPTVPAASPSSSSPTQATEIQIPEADITWIRVLHQGSILIDAESSGPIGLTKSPRCELKGQPCYDPPSLTKVAWINGARPSVPSNKTVYPIGHSNRFGGDGVFTRLAVVQAGDLIDLTTKAGVFNYRVTKIEKLSFAEVANPNSDFWQPVGGQIKVATCDIAPGAGSYDGNFVVTAMLESAKAL